MITLLKVNDTIWYYIKNKKQIVNMIDSEKNLDFLCFIKWG